MSVHTFCTDSVLNAAAHTQEKNCSCVRECVVCMCVCVCAYVSVCVCIQEYANQDGGPCTSRKRPNACAHFCESLCVYVLYVCVCMYVCVYVRICVDERQDHTHILIIINHMMMIYKHTHIHTHTHMHTHKPGEFHTSGGTFRRSFKYVNVIPLIVCVCVCAHGCEIETAYIGHAHTHTHAHTYIYSHCITVLLQRLLTSLTEVSTQDL